VAKLLSWDPANGRFKEVSTGLVLSDTAEPSTVQSGDLWLDTNDLKLFGHISGASTQLGSLVPPTFSPFDVGWTEAYWADDPDWSNPGDGNSVSSWRSGGSGARAVENGTGANQPIFRSSVLALNNHAAVDFDGSNDNLYTSTFTLDVPHNLVVVGMIDSVPGERYVVSYVANDNGLFVRSATGTWSMYTLGYINGGAYTIGAGAALRVRSSDTVLDNEIVTNGTSSGLTGNSYSNTNDGLSLGGARANGGFCGDCHIAFVGYYEGDVTADVKWSELVSWVSSYYGLTLA
jgi:hypothetical protein